MAPGLEVMGMIRIATVAAISLVCVLGRVTGAEWQAPRITRAEVDWESAAQKLGEVAPLRAVHASADAGVGGREIDRLNAAVVERLPGIASSPVPVLLPFDVDAWLRDRTAHAPADADAPPDPADKYFAGFGQPALFAPGPAGYDATFRFPVAAVPGLANIRFGGRPRCRSPARCSPTNSTRRSPPPAPRCPRSKPIFPASAGSLESRVRYAFVRFGVPYVVSIDCFDAGFARYHHMACRDADR